MQIFHHISELQQSLRAERQNNKRIGLVPTMGNLHAGHLKLVETASQHCDHTVATIFVNPLQFGRNEDLDAYPRTLEQDIAHLEKAGCHSLLAPSVAEMYPYGLDTQTAVSVPELSARHCGASRPGHFAGVATVVSKLFNIVGPDVAIFGLKDYQQFLVIRKMVQDLCFPIDIVGVETWREDNGLAMSSRNGYLSAQQKTLAGNLYKCLQETAALIKAGRTDFAELEAEAKARLEALEIRTDYFSVCQADTLEPALATDADLVILLGAFVGTTRLIDNIRCTRQ